MDHAWTLAFASYYLSETLGEQEGRKTIIISDVPAHVSYHIACLMKDSERYDRLCLLST